MDIEAIRRYCLQFPHTTENVQWGADLCFQGGWQTVRGDRARSRSAGTAQLQVHSRNFTELCERPGVRPAPYLARAQWVALEQLNTLPDSELRDLIAESYRLVWERLPKKRREELQGAGPKSARRKAAPGKSAAKTKRAQPARRK